MDVRPYLIFVSLAFRFHAAHAEEGGAPPLSPLSPEKWRERNCIHEGEGRRTYCKRQLEALDLKLNVAFREALATGHEQTSLRADQRRWLVHARDVCEGLECSSEVMMGRILELHAKSIAARGRLEKPMTGEEQLQICGEIAALESRGEAGAHLIEAGMMPEKVLTAEERAKASGNLDSSYGHMITRIFSLPIRGDQDVAFADLDSGGTCNSNEIYPLWTPSLRPTEKWPVDYDSASESIDELRWAHWGGWDSILVHRGRYLLAASTSRGISTITWITPGATLRPLCSLQTTQTVRSVVVSRANRKLCEAAAAKTLTPIPTMETDIDNDGVKESLQQHHEDSGAACGSSEIWYEVIDRETGKPTASALNKALAGLTMWNENAGEIYDFENVRYIEAQLNGAPALFKLTKDSVDTECIFRDQAIKKVSTVFPLDGVVRDPAVPSAD